MTPGDKTWWLIVQSAPVEEAELMLRSYRNMLLRENAGKSLQVAAQAEITKVNDEIHRVMQIQSRATWQRAVREVCGDDGYARVRERVVMLQAEASGRMGRPM